MLILTRKTDQGIVFSGNVTIRILSVDGERVKIGIDAPRSVQVLREELVAVPANTNGSTSATDASSPNGAVGSADVRAKETAVPSENSSQEPPNGARQAVS